jgi:hypothetical protein
VRYCVTRIERELGEIEHWSVTIAPASGEFTSVVAVQDGSNAIESTGTGMDGPLAAWEALCRLEQRLREVRAQRTADPALAAGAPVRRHLVLVDGSGAR